MIKQYTIKFDEELHRYTIAETDEVCISVTQKIGQIIPPFDTDRQAQAYAEKHGGTAEGWKAEWARITKEACDRGNVTHNALEDGIDTMTGVNKKIEGTNYTVNDIKNCVKMFKISRVEIESSPLQYMFPKIYARIIYYLKKGYILVTERITYWYEWLIAGKLDLLLLNKANKSFRILDWKTNKDEMHDEAGYYKKHNGVKTNQWVTTDERLLFPLKHLQHCKKVIYTLQLSLYALLIEQWGYTLEADGLELWHIRNGVEKGYILQYLKNDALKIARFNGQQPPKAKISFGIKPNIT